MTKTSNTNKKAGLQSGFSISDQNTQRRNSRSTATPAQEQRLLSALRRRTRISTDMLRRIGIFCPASRVYSLRCKGYVISTQLIDSYDLEGFMHVRMAWYRLERLSPSIRRGK